MRLINSISPYPSLKPTRFGSAAHSRLQPHLVRMRCRGCRRSLQPGRRRHHRLNVRRQPRRIGIDQVRREQQKSIRPGSLAGPHKLFRRLRCRSRSQRPPERARLVCPTAAETTAENSSSVSEKNSPVPPAANRPAGLLLQQPVNVARGTRARRRRCPSPAEMCDREREQARSNRFRQTLPGTSGSWFSFNPN